MAAYDSVHDATPVLVGVGRYTFRRKGRPQQPPGAAWKSPFGMLLEAARRALRDAGQAPEGAVLDSIAHVSSATDAQVIMALRREETATPKKGAPGLGADRFLYPNTPGVVAAALGCPAGAVQELVCTGDSGHMPQVLVSRAFEKIARGELQSALILGGEALHSFNAMRAAGVSLKEVKARWGEAELTPDAIARLRQLEGSVGLAIHPPGKTIEEANLFYTELNRRHGLGAPHATYPIFENALRVKLGRTLPEQQAAAASIFAEFSKVAASDQENAWFATAYTPEELGSESAENRRICHPFYVKRLNSVMAVDMSAAMLVMSAGEARRRGVPREKWIFLHGCSEAADRLEILERPSLCASPAIRHAGGRALAMAGVRDVNREVDFLDIYSCFPVAVQVACAELGITLEGGKPLTVTGGLPYHGGPGSNYVTHAIAAAAEKLRQHPGRARALVTANGGYLTKHAFGVYANFPDKAAALGSWHREDPAACQAAVDALPREPVAEAPAGVGTVETYCVRLGRDGRPELGIIVGKLDDGRRFVANTPPGDAEMLAKFVDGDPIGATGLVICVKGKSTFHLHGKASRL